MSHCGPDTPLFLALNHQAAWERGLAVDLEITAEGLRLAESTEYGLRDVLDSGDLPAGLVDADFALGRCGLLYMLLDLEGETTAALRIFDPAQGTTEAITCIERRLGDPASLAYTPPGQACGVDYGASLYIGELTGEIRLTALAEIGWQVRWTLGPQHDTAGAHLALGALLDSPLAEVDDTLELLPIDLAIDPMGCPLVLTPLIAPDGEGNLPAEIPAGTPLALIRLDRGGRKVSAFTAAELEITVPVPSTGLRDVMEMALAPDGSLWFLEPAARRLLRLDLDAGTITVLDLSMILPEEIGVLPSGLAFEAPLNPEDPLVLLLGDGREGLAGGEEDDRVIYRLHADLGTPEEPSPTPLGTLLGTITGYRGQTAALIVDGRGRILVFNREEKRILFLDRGNLFRGPGGGRPRGTWYSPLFDSTEEAMLWHKLLLDRQLPPGTGVAVSYLTSEDDAYQGALNTARGSLDPTPLEGFSWSAPLVDPRDALLRSEPGRYLALRLTLAGSPTATPLVRGLEVHFPRRSYLSLLPAVYSQEGAGHDSFPERFLALFETFLGGSEEAIDILLRFFDTEAVEGEWLPWLASWLALAADPIWPVESLRTWLREAPELFRRRGTRDGLSRVIEIFTGAKPLVIENWQLRCAEDPELLCLFEQLYGTDPYAFCVLLAPDQVEGDAERRAVRRLVVGEKPAHTAAGVRRLLPGVTLDHHTYLEINTRLTRQEPRLDLGAVIPRDTVLTDDPEVGQIGRRSRLGLDTSLT